MKRKVFLAFSLLLVLIIAVAVKYFYFEEKPKIAFTFDDGSVQDTPILAPEEWNKRILDHLNEHDLQAMFFVAGSGVDSEYGKKLVGMWDNAGHLIGNHTYHHSDFHADTITFEKYKEDFLKGETFVSKYSNFKKYFRFPYLGEGNTKEKRDQIRDFLNASGYKKGYVTIDNSDWYIYSRLMSRLEADPQANLAPYRKYYLEHIYERAQYYDKLSTEIVGRKVNHTLLLHHNLTSALFLGDLIKMFKEKGWEVIDASEAFQDEVYSKEPDIVPAAGSLIWGLAKESKKYEESLRFPPESNIYEKDKMDKLGL